MSGRIIATLILGALAMPAAAATYNFSYTFNTGQLVVGSFDGTAAGDLVTIDSPVTMTFDGVAFAGPLIARGSTATAGDGSQCGTVGCFVAPAMMSADPAKNNFLIADYASAPGFPGTNYFYIFPWSGSPLGLGLQAWFGGNYYNLYNGQYVPANWSLTGGAVPEPATWALLLGGFGAVGAAARRRRWGQAVAA